MFRVDRFVKWRTRVSSSTSGKGGGDAAAYAAGSVAAGTSGAGARWHRRPGRDASKISSADCVLVMADSLRNRLLQPPLAGAPEQVRRVEVLGRERPGEAVVVELHLRRDGDVPVELPEG